MLVTTTKEFQETVLRNLSFSSFKLDNCVLFHNPKRPELGNYIRYFRNDYYEFGIADYTVSKDFNITFDNPSLLMRFGTLYEGATKFKLEDKPISSFTPSSFFVVEKNLKGKQVWKEGWHYHGAEVILYEKYFTDILYPSFSPCVTHEDFLSNYTYNFLPLGIISIIQQLSSLSIQGKLTSIYLESKIMECIAILTEEIKQVDENTFTNQLYTGNVKIGSNRFIKLSSSDINAIQKAHDILTKEYENPPTIASLSRLVLLNEQKLKAGFSARYHMSIGEYSNTVRMSVAANLLSSTDLSVEEIGKRIGYQYCGNFTAMFKKAYGKTPLQFRKSKK